MAFEEVIRLLTTSRRYCILLIRAIFLNVSSEIKKFNLGLMKNKTNSEQSRDRKKHKISEMRDTDISLCHLRFSRCHGLAPVVQTLESTIDWISQYPADKYSGN